MRQQGAGKPAEDLIHSGLQLGRRERLLAFNAAAVVSLLVHVGILLAALDWFGRIDQGAIRVVSDAVSVELVATDTLDALKPERPSDPARSPEATAPVAGSSTPSQSSEETERLEKHAPVEKSALAVPDANDAETRAAKQDEPVDAPAADSPVETVRELPKATIEGEDARSKQRETTQVEKRAARPKGGITSKAEVGKGKGSGRVSASTGTILTYAALVRARVAGNRPSGSAAGGTAIVAFGLTSTGALAYARIARSSGNAGNDRIALGAVRGAAPFPPPPTGATPRQLQFTIPYYFQ